MLFRCKNCSKANERKPAGWRDGYRDTLKPCDHCGSDELERAERNRVIEAQKTYADAEVYRIQGKNYFLIKNDYFRPI